jgi:hypothetical protein
VGRDFDSFDSVQFLRVSLDVLNELPMLIFLQTVKILEQSGVVKPYHPHLPSGLASIYRSFHRQKQEGKQYGQYKYGLGNKAIYWYWEFDVEEGYFHEIQTLDFMEAMKIYHAAKFEIWKESWVPPSQSKFLFVE